MSTAWSGLRQFAEGFSIGDLAGTEELRTRFELYAEYVDSLIRVTSELRRPELIDLGNGEEDVARLECVAQDMAESLFLALPGMYSASAIVFRCAIEGIFQYLADDGIQLPHSPGGNPRHENRPPPKLPTHRTPSPGEINKWLEYYGSENMSEARSLGRVYQKISSVAHRDDKRFIPLADFLRSIPRRDFIEDPDSEAAKQQLKTADWLQNVLERGCVLGTLVIKARFARQWSHRNFFTGTEADLNRVVEKMAERRDQAAGGRILGKLLEAERAGRN